MSQTPAARSASGAAVVKHFSLHKADHDVSSILQENVTRSGRLNLCPKTRELTDDSPRYMYPRNNVATNDNNGGSGGERSGKAVAPVHGLLARGAALGHYRDAGDRLYSEWEASRRKTKPRGSQQHPDVEGRGGSSREAWSCPKCGAFNR